MPYRVINPVHGQEVGYEYIRHREQAPDPALVFDTMPEGAIWDGATMQPRPPSSTDKFYGVFEEAIDRLAASCIESLESYFTGEHGRDETTHLLVASVGAIFDHLGWPLDPRLQAVRDAGNAARLKQDKLNTLASQVQAGTKTPEQAIIDIETILSGGTPA